MDSRGLAHECRVEATNLRSTELLQVTVSRETMAGLLERCATSLEEMDAADRVSVPALEQIEADALRTYRAAYPGPKKEFTTINAQLGIVRLAEHVIGLCAYLKKEKASA